jgi:hypothetical protein
VLTPTAVPATAVANGAMPVVPQRAGSLSTPTSQSEADQASSSSSVPTASSTAASPAKVAAAMRAFELTPTMPATVRVSALGPTAAVVNAVTRAPAARHHVAKPTPAGKAGGTPPTAPSGPSPNAAGTGAGTGAGGLSSAPWCDLCLVLLALLGLELRRHRARPILAGPVGVVFPLQRPG